MAAPSLPDLASMTLNQITDYRHELIHAVLEPGADFDEWDQKTRNEYKALVAEIDAYLAENYDYPPGGNLP